VDSFRMCWWIVPGWRDNLTLSCQHNLTLSRQHNLTLSRQHNLTPRAYTT
jgi:hypothetical protein